MDPLTGYAHGQQPAVLGTSRPPQTRRPAPRRQKAKSQNDGEGMGSIVSGVLMMVGAVVWLVAGLFAGYIFFYPPILFIIGLVAVIKGIFKF